MAEAGRAVVGGGEKEEEGEEGARDEKVMVTAASRKEKRKDRKRMKRKQARKEMAAREREEEERRMNDPEEQKRLKEMEEEERLRMEKDRKEFEEREKKLLEEMEEKLKEEEEEAARRDAEEEAKRRLQSPKEDGCDEDGDWEYVEEGPAEIIWQGNEIIVRKKRVRVPKKIADAQRREDANRPTSNPLPPESESGLVNASLFSAQQMLENVAQQVPNFGTEQDKAHCPFHLKTGACRFGQRCSRVHFYPDKACTLLIKNMYGGPGLAWEQDEGLEHTDEEVERSYEEFYEDVHTEFLKYGEIVNFKVCRNSSSHLRGNVYVHYKSLDSAVLAYESINGRFFAGKQITCEFVNITRWKVAICGEYMKSRLQTCSRGNACNFIHCFRNPCGDYEWADWDKPPPRFWIEKMTALFGSSVDSEILHREDEWPDRFYSRRSMSRDIEHWSERRRRGRDDYGHEEDRHRPSGSRRIDYTSGEEGWSDRDRRSSRSRSHSSRNHYEENRRKDRRDENSVIDEMKKGSQDGQPASRRRTSRVEQETNSRREKNRQQHDSDDFDYQLENESKGRRHAKRWHRGHEEEDSDSDNHDDDDGGGGYDGSTKRLKQNSEMERLRSQSSRTRRRRHSSRVSTEQGSSITTYEDRWGA